jgi:hypothetical protein
MGVIRGLGLPPGFLAFKVEQKFQGNAVILQGFNTKAEVPFRTADKGRQQNPSPRRGDSQCRFVLSHRINDGPFVEVPGVYCKMSHDHILFTN